MNYDEMIVEYYDELFPVLLGQIELFKDLLKEYPQPAKILRIGCATGTFEHYLAKEGFDVTGIDDNNGLIEAANRKRRTQLMALRYFKMSILEMGRFLGKKFYNIISILDNQLSLITDKVLLDKFFFDVGSLISENGTLIIETWNSEKILEKEKESDSKNGIMLPERKSIRSKYLSSIKRDANDETFLYGKLENGSGRLTEILSHEKIVLWEKSVIEELAKKNGFTKIEYKKPFDGDENKLLMILK